LACKPVIDRFLRQLEIPDQCADRYHGSGVPWFQPLQAADDAVYVAAEEPRDSRLTPLL
jgi:hypothetical protein